MSTYHNLDSATDQYQGGCFWNGNAEKQSYFDSMWRVFVPDSGEASYAPAESVRVLARLNHDLFNNGYGNVLEVRETTDDWGDDILETEVNPYYDRLINSLSHDQEEAVREFNSWWDDVNRGGRAPFEHKRCQIFNVLITQILEQEQVRQAERIAELQSGNRQDLEN